MWLVTTSVNSLNACRIPLMALLFEGKGKNKCTKPFKSAQTTLEHFKAQWSRKKVFFLFMKLKLPTQTATALLHGLDDQ